MTKEEEENNDWILKNKKKRNTLERGRKSERIDDEGRRKGRDNEYQNIYIYDDADDDNKIETKERN